MLRGFHLHCSTYALLHLHRVTTRIRQLQLWRRRIIPWFWLLQVSWVWWTKLYTGIAYEGPRDCRRAWDFVSPSSISTHHTQSSCGFCPPIHSLQLCLTRSQVSATVRGPSSLTMSNITLVIVWICSGGVLSFMGFIFGFGFVDKYLSAFRQQHNSHSKCILYTLKRTVLIFVDFFFLDRHGFSF